MHPAFKDKAVSKLLKLEALFSSTFPNTSKRIEPQAIEQSERMTNWFILHNLMPSIFISHPAFRNCPATLTFKMVRDQTPGHSSQRKDFVSRVSITASQPERSLSQILDTDL
ncbi:hypothetical protein NPIL_360371 [Nephila pilipes]|uniref:Uncharacterized protein n=1 Tax=Nephila pilipes TaxID=299642 RepID=A0A8X6NU13_NEPPI|nr:hypothetical protein NPIL_360371 [Nephila pilipes]